VPNGASQTDALERKIVLALKEERLKQELSAAQLAVKIGVSRAAITHIEADRCRPSLWIIIKMADGLGINFADCVAEVRKPRKR